jgi:pimeloyl-ACP methyl ester carboxylesterase
MVGVSVRLTTMTFLRSLRSFSVDVDPHQFACLEWGQWSAHKPTIVYLHGWLDNAASFLSVMEQVAIGHPQAHQLAFDLQGHGLSSHKRVSNFYPFHDYIDDLHQLIRSLALKNCILVGHSLGGLIASCYSAAFPEYVLGLIQIDGIGPLGETSDNAVKRLRDGVISRDRVRRKPRKGYASFELALAHKAKTIQLDPSVIYALVERGIECLDGTWRWRADNELSAQALYRMSSQQVDCVLSHIKAPFDIVVAQDGLITQRKDIQRWRPSHTQLHYFPGGHHCHLEHPERLAQLIGARWQII